MHKKMNSSESGKTIIEMMIVLVIAAILVTFAVTQLSGAGNNLDRQNIAREFKVSLERARFDSVRRRASDCNNMARVTFTSATTFTLLTDLNQNGTLEPSTETRTIDFSRRSEVTLTGTSLTYPIVVRFDQRGSATSGTCSSPAATVPPFTFCNAPCSTVTPQNSNIVYVSPTGTATMMYGGQSMPTFANPTVSNINSALRVNPRLAVWDPPVFTPTPSPTPTPIPTATPSATPTPTPSPTGTVSPSPSTSPTVTPTPQACLYGQRPSTTGCICVSPMWVRSSGKCQ